APRPGPGEERAQPHGRRSLDRHAGGGVNRVGCQVPAVWSPGPGFSGDDMRTIAIRNQSTLVSSAELASAVIALQTQLDRDFAPAWGQSARLEINGGGPEVIYLFDDTDAADALGYHTLSAGDVPIG